MSAIDLLVKAAKIIGVLILIFIVLMVAMIAFLKFDIMSYTATGSETIKGNSTAQALIVYDPGLSGNPENVANLMASDLNARGYNVTVAGIRSNGISDASEYSVVIVGGPIYYGSPTDPVRSYLQNVKLSENSKVGVYALGMSEDQPGQGSYVMAGDLTNRSVTPKASMKLLTNETYDAKCNDFVSKVVS
jgi:menaquinone-dependent protoporphyrinogen IX oxidase